MVNYPPPPPPQKKSDNQKMTVTEQLKIDVKRESRIALLAKVMTESRPLYRSMIFEYAELEVLNFLNVILQIKITDLFLRKQFINYGLEVMKDTESELNGGVVHYNHMLKVFPRMTKCTFRYFGNSGDLQKKDLYCLLPINIVNEKIYLFLWFWFCFLAVISLLGLVYRLATLVSPLVRQLTTNSRNRMTDSVSKKAFASIIRYQDCGTWFFLDLLSRNMDPMNFKQLIVEFDQAIQPNDQYKIENNNFSQ